MLPSIQPVRGRWIRSAHSTSSPGGANRKHLRSVSVQPSNRFSMISFEARAVQSSVKPTVLLI